MQFSSTRGARNGTTNQEPGNRTGNNVGLHMDGHSQFSLIALGNEAYCLEHEINASTTTLAVLALSPTRTFPQSLATSPPTRSHPSVPIPLARSAWQVFPACQACRMTLAYSITVAYHSEIGLLLRRNQIAFRSTHVVSSQI